MAVQRDRFTRKEAKAKVGLRVRSLRDFSGVPRDTQGVVVEADHMGEGHYDLVTEWELPREQPSAFSFSVGGEPVMLVNTGKPLRDWFTRDEFENYLASVR
jgi:hypothetical protein